MTPKSILLLFTLFCCSFLHVQSGNVQRSADKKMVPHIQTIAQKYNQSEFGTNTFVFDPSMDMSEIQELLDSIHAGLTFPDYEFTNQRYAYMFKPGVYQLDIQVGYYTHIIGLGQSPDDVIIQGTVRSNATKGLSLIHI